MRKNLGVEVKEKEGSPEMEFKEDIERLMKKALRLFRDSNSKVFLINQLEIIREYLDDNSAKE